jgi:very-short-patch-repair endonuclease
VEYDGAHHRGPDQHRADNAREHRLEQAGLIVIRFDNQDTLRTQARTLAVMQEARQRGLRRDRRHDGWSRSNVPWWFDVNGP